MIVEVISSTKIVARFLFSVFGARNISSHFTQTIFLGGNCLIRLDWETLASEVKKLSLRLVLSLFVFVLLCAED